MTKLRGCLEMYEKLGNWESGDKNDPYGKGNYKKINSYDFIGKYQMGVAALEDAGYYIMSKEERDKEGRVNLWNGTFKGTDNVNSVQDYLDNEEAQEKAVRKFHEKKREQLEKTIKSFTKKI